MIGNPVPWPDGARCAVVFTFDMDADSILLHPGPIPELGDAEPGLAR